MRNEKKKHTRAFLLCDMFHAGLRHIGELKTKKKNKIFTMITCRYVTNSKVDISFVSLPCHVFFILEEKLQREPETL